MSPWLVLLVLPVVAVVAVVWASQRRDDERDNAALQVLDQRLAQGDLTVEEHAQRRQVLRDGDRNLRAQSGRWGRPTAVIAAASFAVILLVWLGMTSWGGTGWMGGNGWMGGHMGWGGSTSSTAEVADGAREVEIEAGELWFKPATVEMTVGVPVNLRLVNTGDAFHDLTVPAANVVLAAEPGEQAVGAVEFNSPGRYEFFCSVTGHARGGMRGTIVVTAAG